MDLGKYAEAAAEFEAAYADKQDPTLLLNLAQAYRLAGNASRRCSSIASTCSTCRSRPTAPRSRRRSPRWRRREREATSTPPPARRQSGHTAAEHTRRVARRRRQRAPPPDRVPTRRPALNSAWRAAAGAARTNPVVSRALAPARNARYGATCRRGADRPRQEPAPGGLVTGGVGARLAGGRGDLRRRGQGRTEERRDDRQRRRHFDPNRGSARAQPRRPGKSPSSSSAPRALAAGGRDLLPGRTPPAEGGSPPPGSVALLPSVGAGPHGRRAAGDVLMRGRGTPESATSSRGATAVVLGCHRFVHLFARLRQRQARLRSRRRRAPRDTLAPPDNKCWKTGETPGGGTGGSDGGAPGTGGAHMDAGSDVPTQRSAHPSSAPGSSPAGRSTARCTDGIGCATPSHLHRLHGDHPRNHGVATVLAQYYCQTGWTCSSRAATPWPSPPRTRPASSDDRQHGQSADHTAYTWSAVTFSFTKTGANTGMSTGHLMGPFTASDSTSGRRDLSFTGPLTKN